MQRLSGMVIVGVLALGSVGCGDDKGSSTPKADTTLYGMLHSVPDTEINRLTVISYGNFERARNGTRKGSGEADLKLLIERTDGEVTLPADLGGILQAEFLDYAGFDTRNIDAALEYGNLPDAVAVVAGRFDPKKVEKALASSPGGEQLTATDDGEVRRLGLANDIASRSAIRSLGQPLEIAVTGNSLVWARSAAVVDACLAVRSGSGSLADDTAYAAVATVLDGASVTSALLTAPLAGETWTLAGIGEVRDGKQSVVTVVLQYADAASATAAVEAFRTHIERDDSLRAGKPWKDLVEISDLRNVGATLIATLNADSAGLGRAVIQSGDTLLRFG